jgi:hypothetical protein
MVGRLECNQTTIFAVIHRKENMKYKYAAVLVPVLVTTLSLAAVAYGQVVSNPTGVLWMDSPRVKSYPTERPIPFLLKSNGEVIAELRARAGTSSELTAGGRVKFNRATHALSATNGFALKITDGTNSVSARADEIQPEPSELAKKQAPGERAFLLKSGGATIAELWVRASAGVAIANANSSGHSEYNTSTGTVAATGGAILTVTAGTSSTSVRADEIEGVSVSK